MAASLVGLHLRELTRPSLNATILKGTNKFKKRLLQLLNSDRKSTVVNNEMLMLNEEFNKFPIDSLRDPTLS